MNRAYRSTRAQLVQAEAHQDVVISDLAENGHGCIAERLRRCQRDRQHRQDSQRPWRCRTPGCWACRRSLVRRWWQAFNAWATGPRISLAVISLSGDPISGTRTLRKSLRDLRDRFARQDRRWRSVAMAGLAGGGRMLLLIRHPGLDRASVWLVLKRRWLDVLLTDAGSVNPVSAMTVEAAATLARCRRGIEPLRVVVLPQVAAAAVAPDGWREPMPTLF